MPLRSKSQSRGRPPGTRESRVPGNQDTSRAWRISASDGILRRGAQRSSVVLEGREEEEGIAKPDLGAPKRRQQIVLCIQLGKHLGDWAATERKRSDAVPASLAEFAKPERVRRVRVAQEIVAVGVEEEVLPGLDQVDPPEAVIAAQQYRDEACGRPLARGYRIVAFDAVLERLRGIDPLEPFQFLEWRERVARAHEARALREKVERRVANEVGHHRRKAATDSFTSADGA